MTVTHLPQFAVVVVLVTAAALMIVPVEATYLNNVGSDTVEFRTASCGSPIASLLGADPDLVGMPEFIGGETSTAACQAVSGKRVIGALALLLAASIVWGLSRRSTPPISVNQRLRRRGQPQRAGRGHSESAMWAIHGR